MEKMRMRAAFRIFHSIPSVWQRRIRSAGRRNWLGGPGGRAWPVILAGLMLMLMPGRLPAQTSRWYTVEYVTNRQGLSESCISAMCQDRTGYLWIATADGLNKYDGYQFKVYRHDPQDPRSISGSYVLSVMEDRAGNIWAGTFDGGLNRMNPHREEFRRYTYQPDDPFSLSNNHVRWIMEDRAGAIWAATNGGGVNRLDPSTGRFSQYRHHPGRTDTLSSDSICCLYEDPERPGQIWTGTSTGIDLLDTATGSVTRYGPFAENGQALNTLVWMFRPAGRRQLWAGTNRGLYLLDTRTGNLQTRPLHPDGEGSRPLMDTIYAICEGDPAKEKMLWLGTRQNGLLQYFPATGRCVRFDPGPGAPGQISQRMIVSLLRDRSQNIWAGSWSFWITKIIPRRFQLIQAIPGNPQSLMDNRIYDLAAGPGGTVWISDRLGLNHYDPATGQFQHYRPDPADPGSLSGSRALGVCVQPDGTLWAGTLDAGLNMLAPGSRRFFHYRHNPSDPNSLTSDSINLIFLDHRGRLWIVHAPSGIDCLDTSTRRITRYRHLSPEPFSQSSDQASCLAEDKDGILWAGTQRGNLYRLEESSGQFRKWERQQGSSRNQRQIYVIHSRIWQGRKQIWTGSEGCGLECLDLVSGEITPYFFRDGFSSNVVYGLVEDRQGFLWLSTTTGITRLDPASGRHRTFVFPDGPFNNEFASQVYLHHPDGSFYFGGNLGVICFRPEEFLAKGPVPAVALTGLKVLNQPRRFDRPLEQVKEIVLAPGENLFTFEFASFDLTEPTSNRYAYQLEGVDQGWIECGNRHFANYAGVEPGRYTFRVKGTDFRGEWSEKAVAARLRIDPPFWRNRWFQLLLAMLVLCSAVAAHYGRLRHSERRRRELEKQVAQRTLELSARNEELEKLNSIIKTVNSEFDLDDLIRSMLQEACAVLQARRAMALSLDPGGQRLAIRHSIGMEHLPPGEPVNLPVRLIDDLQQEGRPLMPDILLTGNSGKTILEPLLPGSSPAGLLVILIRTTERIESLLIFQPGPEQSFSASQHLLLNNLKEHFRLAFIKIRLLDNLRILNQKKNRLLGLVAHDLRSPLSGIYSCIKLLQDDLDRGEFNLENCRSDLGLVTATAEQLLELINELLSHSAIESGEIRIGVEPLDLPPLVRNQVVFHRRLADRKQIGLTLEEPSAPFPPVLADPGRTIEVLGNLLSNAVKYTHPGGNIRVWLEQLGGEVVVHIHDNGQGLSPEDQEQLFCGTRRLSARPTGGEPSTGFGLAITKLIVERMNGRIWVESRPGAGSTFSFSLPLVLAESSC